jgi:hypothetical protein
MVYYYTFIVVVQLLLLRRVCMTLIKNINISTIHDDINLYNNHIIYIINGEDTVVYPHNHNKFIFDINNKTKFI